MADRIDKANFKKIWIVFIISAAVICLASSVILYTHFSSRLASYDSKTSATTQEYEHEHDRDHDHDSKIESFMENGMNRTDKIMLGVTGTLIGLTGLAYWLIMTFWMIQRSSKDGANQFVFGFLTLFFNIAAVVAYFIYRHFTLRCQACGESVEK